MSVPWERTPGANENARLLGWICNIAVEPARRLAGLAGLASVLRARHVFNVLAGGAHVESLRSPGVLDDLTFTLRAAAEAASSQSGSVRGVELATTALSMLGLVGSSAQRPARWEDFPPALVDMLRKASPGPAVDRPSTALSAENRQLVEWLLKLAWGEAMRRGDADRRRVQNAGALLHYLANDWPFEWLRIEEGIGPSLTTMLGLAETAAARLSDGGHAVRRVGAVRQALFEMGLLQIRNGTGSLPSDSSFDAVLRQMIREVLREELKPIREALEQRDGKKPADQPTEYLSVSDAAQIAGVAPGTIRTWIRKGELRTYRAGRVLRVKRSDLDRFLSRVAVTAQAPPDYDELAAKILEQGRQRKP